MRARRLISLLLLLQLGRRWTAAEFAARLGSSVRTVHRDIGALMEAGVPVRAERGPGGGFTLSPNYRARLPLSVDEVQALLLGAPSAARALGLGALLLDGQLKLLGSLPPDLRRAAARARELFHVDEPRWFNRTDESPFLLELASASSEQRRIHVAYGRTGRLVSEILEPLGLVLKAGVWYLAARTGEALRIYRVSRIASLTSTDQRFSRPSDFDLVSFWDKAREEFETSRPRLDVILLIDPADIPALRAAIDWTVRAALDQGVIETPDGRVEVSLPFERLEYAYADLVKLGGAVEVVEPLELRTRLALTGRELVIRYREDVHGLAPAMEPLN
jgi:predicted DNA-binding transcriptional regulator YafY